MSLTAKLGITAITAAIAAGVCVLPASHGVTPKSDHTSPMNSAIGTAGVDRNADALGVKRYLKNNELSWGWSEDGVKGTIKNFTNKDVTVKDRKSGDTYRVGPGDELVYYSDADLVGNSGCDAGDGAYLEFYETG